MHRLFLIRHGETVDNIAGLYAGSRDSALTNHGVQQTLRLGQHFADAGVELTHIFSSDLSRAFKTAEAIRTAQPDAGEQLRIAKCTELREQHFGYLEGVSFQGQSGQRGDDQSSSDKVETHDAMAVRADAFLDSTLMPLLMKSGDGCTIAIVSHGMLLTTLWRRMLRRQLPDTVLLGPEAMTAGRPFSLERLGGWANTGYLEVTLEPLDLPRKGSSGDGMAAGTEQQGTGELAKPERRSSDASAVTDGRQSNSAEELGMSVAVRAEERKYALTIKAINARGHLKSLKRTGGGLGSSRFDEDQKSIDSFFKRQKRP